MRNKKRLVCLLLVAVCMVSCFFAMGQVFADETVHFTGSSGSLTRQQLFSETSTYNCTSAPNDQKDSTGQNLLTTFDLSTSGKNSNTVKTGEPQITVFTHGMAGGAFHWSNREYDSNKNDQFMYNEDSLIFQLAEQRSNAVIYWAYMTGYNEFNLIPVTKDNSGKYIIPENPNAIDSTQIIAESSIIVLDFNTFNVDETYKGKDTFFLYNAFNYTLSKIVYEVKLLNGGQLPSLNMIGYSMGGLLNMRYALDHPGMVKSLISLGTPYFGSNTAMLIGEGGPVLRAQREDINNPEIYNEMAQRWNAGRETLYADVSFHAFGGYSTFDFITACLAEEHWWVYPLSLITNQVVAGLVPVVEMAEFVADIVGLEGKPTDDPNFMTGLRNFVNSFGYDGWQTLLLRPTLFDDISVQLPSALASNSPYQGAASTLEYAGVIRHPIKLTLFNSDISKAATISSVLR